MRSRTQPPGQAPLTRSLCFDALGGFVCVSLRVSVCLCVLCLYVCVIAVSATCVVFVFCQSVCPRNQPPGGFPVQFADNPRATSLLSPDVLLVQISNGSQNETSRIKQLSCARDMRHNQKNGQIKASKR